MYFLVDYIFRCRTLFFGAGAIRFFPAGVKNGGSEKGLVCIVKFVIYVYPIYQLNEGQIGHLSRKGKGKCAKANVAFVISLGELLYYVINKFLSLL